jgi:catechol 2,3-dioxygenase-like lactoylglutathione lyase family enzyme
MVPARLTVVTLGARDLPALRSFYERLGWALAVDTPEFVAFATQGAVLTLWGLDDLAREAHVEAAQPQSGIRLNLAVNVDEPEHVDMAIDTVRAAGGRVTQEPADTDFGGRTAYFVDPEDNLWEVVWVPDDSAVHETIRHAGGFGPAA